jgi:hypothetical protein
MPEKIAKQSNRMETPAEKDDLSDITDEMR